MIGSRYRTGPLGPLLTSFGFAAWTLLGMAALQFDVIGIVLALECHQGFLTHIHLGGLGVAEMQWALFRRREDQISAGGSQ